MKKILIKIVETLKLLKANDDDMENSFIERIDKNIQSILSDLKEYDECDNCNKCNKK